MQYRCALAISILTAATCGVVGGAQAAGMGLRVGSTGIGGDVAWPLSPGLGVRLGVSHFNHGTSVDQTSVRYDADLKLSNLNAFVDYTLKGPFRVTAGLVGTGSRVDITGTPTAGQFTFNGTAYNATDVGVLTGEVKPGRRAAPYLGFGFGDVARKGFGFYADIGVIFQGTPKAQLSATCNPATPAVLCDEIRDNVEIERQRLQSELNSFKYYPVVNIGVSYGF